MLSLGLTKPAEIEVMCLCLHARSNVWFGMRQLEKNKPCDHAFWIEEREEPLLGASESVRFDRKIFLLFSVKNPLLLFTLPSFGLMSPHSLAVGEAILLACHCLKVLLKIEMVSQCFMSPLPILLLHFSSVYE